MENFWDKRYAGADYLFGTQPAAGLIALEPHLVAGGKTLVVADGEGRNSVYLASRGYDVRAKDYSHVAKVKAKALAKEAGVDVDFVLSDIYDAGWSDEAYDNVVAIFIQFVPPERMEEVFTALSRATGAGGTLLIHGYTPEQVALGGGGAGQSRPYVHTRHAGQCVFAHANHSQPRLYRHPRRMPGPLRPRGPD